MILVSALGLRALFCRQHQAVAPGQGVSDDGRLLATESVVPEDWLDYVPGRRGQDKRGHSLTAPHKKLIFFSELVYLQG